MAISRANKEIGDSNRSVQNRLLDAAEQLFCERGYRGTSVRNIAAAAGCNIAAVNYYFGGKSNLYNEVWRCHLHEMRESRIESINEVMSQNNGRPELEDLLRAFSNAFVGPLMDEGKAQGLMKLMAREMVDQHLPKKMFIEELVEPTLSALGKSMAALCPGLDRKKIVLSIISLIGQLVHVIRINEMFDMDDLIGMQAPRLPQMIEHIVDFSAAGIRAAAKE